ncbi:P1 family peptidase [Anaerobacillus isosaccharinicus]|uniref:Aminopeptidase n=1 Tax=Anaerobacillus isosaccharinicus TaxID=1532552 RepID=A0A1S2LI02_9BACI|nr:P1 family peptidase [Anaerobacillus isosaccharinicus]MBA5586114.1 P1 family peptidase [Anaerobacillus isosaccharinicus]QOY35618.1 P1 family peptidase [Anaerobacillus isosaccharinicus]
MKRRKLRELGIEVGKLPTGKKNCITDVEGVLVGHVTLIEDLEGCETVRTGVTAILPHGRNLFREKVIAASYVINGFGKTTGLIQLDELGQIESPIMLTNTFGVPATTQGTLEYMLKQNPEIGDTTGTINIVVGECNDSYLNSIRLLPIKPRHAIEAIVKANKNQVEEGAVGAGTGMVCFGYKGGIGSSSRTVKIGSGSFTVGCLVLSNFGKREEFRHWQYENSKPEPEYMTDGSIMIVLATDAPLSDRGLKRIAKRATIGLGRTGSHVSHGSGDIVIAFSTAITIDHTTEHVILTKQELREDTLVYNQLFQAVAEVTEEAILNSLTMSKTTTGRQGRIVEELPYNFTRAMRGESSESK